MGVFAPIRDYVETLVHPSALHDALMTARHRAFIMPRLLGSFAALALFPLYLLARGAPSMLELLVLGWLVAPILIAYFLSRTGRYESAHTLSALALTGLVTMVSALSGGIESFAAIWLVVVPLEAALSASRRVVAIASTLALAAAGLLALLGAMHMLPPVAAVEQAPLVALGIVSATLYATGLALGAEGLARTSFRLLDAEEARYRLLAQNMTDVITRHGRDGAVLFASPAADTMFGSPSTTLLGHGLFERVHVGDRPAYLTAIGDAAALAESRSVEFRVRRDIIDASGRSATQFAWIEMLCRPFERPNETPGGEQVREVVAVLRDVSRRKQHEEAIEHARAEAERANARKSRFLATMSHELRTPLNAIIGFSEMLTKESTLMLDPKRRGEYAALINESGHHLLSVVNGVLDMSKIETDNFEITPEPFTPAQVLAACYEMVVVRAREAGVTIENSISDDLPEMIADKRALNQILLNLLSNAIRFSDRGGKVALGARAEAGSIVISVEDDGVGISEGDLLRIGEPYFQARASYDRRHGGTGLGLSIVKGLVRLHGGELSIRSRVGEGTRVIVRLPLDCEEVSAAGKSRPPGGHDAGNRVGHFKRPASAVSIAASSAVSGIAPAESDMVVKKSA
ncbi:MAG TPA: PAS domain-containing sensor histidine kinase [Xanthobacteraceae bacterium]|nr:PAS domain-containing sensor histidine kinase [Xanthobacteraceae bacterium]